MKNPFDHGAGCYASAPRIRGIIYYRLAVRAANTPEGTVIGYAATEEQNGCAAWEIVSGGPDEVCTYTRISMWTHEHARELALELVAHLAVDLRRAQELEAK